MSTILARRRQLFAIFMLAFAALFVMTQTALADDAVLQGDTLNSDTTVENDVFLNGSDVALNGTVVGDAFAIGRNVVINGNVQGSTLILAENIVINGEVDGSIYGIAVSLNALSGSTIGRSLYFLGISLITEKEAQIGRDLTAVTLGARLAGSVERNTKAIIGLIEIGKVVLDRVNAVTTGKPIAALQPVSTLVLDPANQQTAPAIFAGSVGPAGTTLSPTLAQEDDQLAAEVPENAAVNWIVDRLRNLITLLVFGGLALWLIPIKVDKWSNLVRSRPLAAVGWGLVAYIVGFIGAAIAFMLILVIGISFAVVTLWGLAWSWWAVGFSALALAFSLFVVAVAFGSKIIVAYLIGRLILERFGSQPNMRKPWPLLLGLIIFVLLCGIPYLGWAISLIVTFLGLGAIWLTYMESKNQTGKFEEAEPTT